MTLLAILRNIRWKTRFVVKTRRNHLRIVFASDASFGAEKGQSRGEHIDVQFSSSYVSHGFPIHGREEQKVKPVKPTMQLRKLLKKPGALPVPGAGHAGHAKLIEDAGFPAVYMSGTFVSFVHGLPDVGLLTLTEMAQQARMLASSVSVPVIADADDGYGRAINVMRTVREYESAGIAAMHLEDMVTKKQGKMTPIPSAVKRIKAAVEARTDPDFCIIGRTDAMAPWRGTDLPLAKRVDDALRRGLAYARAGADVIFIQNVHNAATMKRLCSEIPRPIMVTMGTWDYYPTLNELTELGVKIVVYPVLLRDKIVPIMRSLLRELKKSGRITFTKAEKQGKEAMNEILGMPRYHQLIGKYAD